MSVFDFDGKEPGLYRSSGRDVQIRQSLIWIVPTYRYYQLFWTVFVIYQTTARASKIDRDISVENCRLVPPMQQSVSIRVMAADEGVSHREMLYAS